MRAHAAEIVPDAAAVTDKGGFKVAKKNINKNVDKDINKDDDFDYTPMMEQYFKIKEEYSDCFLLFRVGDFYELFYEDAEIASRELDITLTGKDCGQKEKAPMAGVPCGSIDSYAAKLVSNGHKVAICEQIEEKVKKRRKLKKTSPKGVVERKVIRVITPGTVLDSNMLEESCNNYIMCLFENKKGYGLAVCDVSTGDFFASKFKIKEYNKVIDEIEKFSPAEIICNENLSIKENIERIFDIVPNDYINTAFELSNARKKLCDHFKVLNLNGFGIEKDELIIHAAGALMKYLHDTQKNDLNHILTIKKYFIEKYMLLDITSRRNLELTYTIRDKNKKGSLLWVLDSTKTAMGARLMRSWIEQPLVDADDINKRLDSVEAFKNDPLNREEIKELLNTIYDMERLMAKVSYKTANAKDLNALKNSIFALPYIKRILTNFKCNYIDDIYKDFEELDDVSSLLENYIDDDPPFSIRDGGIIKDGINKELDRLRTAKREGSNWLAELETKEREETGIKNLKIKYNKVFGYFIEVTNSYKDKVPKDRYIRRQTLSNCERYVTKRLKEIEEDIIDSDDKIVDLEYNIFCDVRDRVAENVERIKKAANYISIIDVLQSLGDVADKNGYTKPFVHKGETIDIKKGRHPVVELTIHDTFVPNDCFMDMNENRLAIITGPNMAGKSTYMRQNAILVLMAQMGSFIPADRAEIGICDRIFTRVGASDDLSMGQSTFMVEMNEVANILNNATKKSLIILDEIGRGTSTYDGLSIAWAVLEYIADKKSLGARTLFATHYHELTELEGKTDGVKNYCISVQEKGKEVIFLRKIIRGGADKSYGIHVARLAGVPERVLGRSEEILDMLMEYDSYKHIARNNDKKYYTVKAPEASIIVNEIADIDLDSVAPFEAVKILSDIREKLKKL